MTERRALQLCPSDHPPFRDLCRVHATAMVRAGYDVDTVFLRAPVGTPDPNATYLNAVGNRAMVRALVAHLAGRSVTLTVAHRYRACRIAVSARRTAGVGRILAIAHEYDLFKRLRRRFWQRMMGRDVTFAGVSQPVVDQMRAQHPSVGVPLVVPNALDLGIFDAALLTADVAREALGIAADAYVIAAVGRLHPTKQPQLVLRGFADAIESLPRNARLVFVGDGEERDALRRQIDVAGLALRVTLLGSVEQASRYFAAFDLLLAAPRYDEAFGMTLLEAMAARLPVLCADSPGPRSVLGEAGTYFSDADDLAVKLIDAATGARIEHQRARLEAHFDVSTLARWYVSVHLP